MLRQSFCCTAKRPLGVSMMMLGGLQQQKNPSGVAVDQGNACKPTAGEAQPPHLYGYWVGKVIFLQAAEYKLDRCSEWVPSNSEMVLSGSVSQV